MQEIIIWHACTETEHTDLLRASVLSEGETSRWFGWQAVTGMSLWDKGEGAIFIASGLGLLSSEVRGKTIGMERGLAWGNPVMRLGWGMTWSMPSLFPFLTCFTQRDDRWVLKQDTRVSMWVRWYRTADISAQSSRYNCIQHTHTLRNTDWSFQPLLRLLSSMRSQILWGEEKSNKRTTKGKRGKKRLACKTVRWDWCFSYRSDPERVQTTWTTDCCVGEEP